METQLAHHIAGGELQERAVQAYDASWMPSFSSVAEKSPGSNPREKVCGLYRWGCCYVCYRATSFDNSQSLVEQLADTRIRIFKQRVLAGTFVPNAR
jgi:hypothetical protein